MGYVEIPIDLVRLGMYIRLDLSWFKHPFLRNSFRLSHPEELEALRKLGLETIKYDPDRSDAGDLPPRPAAEKKQLKTEKPAPSGKDAEAEAVRRARVEFVQERRKELTRKEKEYAEAFAQVTHIIRGIEACKEKAIDSARELMDRVAASLMRDTEAMVHLMNLKEQDTILFFHSLNVCILSMILGKHLRYSEAEMAELGMGALLHDIGKQKIPKRVTMKKGTLTRAEIKFLRLHPELGVTLLSNYPDVPVDVRDTVYQHHERCNGKGYPEGRTGESICEFARIVSVADVYDNLTNQGRLNRLLTPHEALSYMFTRLSHELSRGLIVTFIKCLGVYPPGTLVELSDGSIGMVVTTDREQSMKPTVILYDPSFPREEPCVLDLAEENAVHIVCSLRPSEVDPEALAYLQPTRMIGYFVGNLGASQKSA